MTDNIAIRKYTRELVLSTFEGRTPGPVPAGMTITEIIEIANKGQMPYLLFNSLLKVAGDSEEADRIKNALVISTMKTFRQVFTAKEISTAFEKYGIRHQILKGTVMKNLYPSPEMREMSDIDLVVYDENLDRAAKVMEDMGFINHGLIKHHMIFSKGKGLLVEVHWCLIDKSVDRRQYLHFKDNFNSNLKEGFNYTYEFGIEDFYVYMIAHMAKHFFETGCGVRNLVDIYVYQNKYADDMNKEYLYKELDACGIRDFEENMRKLAFIWLEDKECSKFYENLFSYMLDSGIYGKGENGVWSQLAKETEKGNSSAKIHYFFPSIRFMKEKYVWLEKMPFLLPVAWGIRFVSAVFNKKSLRNMEMFKNSSNENVDTMLEIYHTLGLNYRR